MTRSFGAVRVAFIGGGSIARAHLRALQRLQPAVRVVGVHDADHRSAAEFAEQSSSISYPTRDGMLASARPEVVHVCTTAGAHFEAARVALETGAHVYVEKPFVESAAEADQLLAIAASRHRLVCCGHQLLTDPAYELLRRRAPAIRPYTHAESVFHFRSPRLRGTSSPLAQAGELIDVLPHPLYSLIAVLEWMAPDEPVELHSAAVSPASVDALLRAGDVMGRLHVSLTARPVLSTLSVGGGLGTLTADFIRGSLTGVANPGVTPIEKVLNPVFDGLRQATRATSGVLRRLASGQEYPGLAQLIERFYDAVRRDRPSPVSPGHLSRTVRVYEDIAINVRESAQRQMPVKEGRDGLLPSARVVVVTGASGFFGRAIAAAVASRGFHVRGVGRGPDPGDANIHSWVRADLSRSVPDDAFRGASVVVHAAAATDGGFAAHQRHSVDAGVNVVDAAVRAGVRRLLHISSLSVVRPPEGRGEIQDESTPLAAFPRRLGPYTWGKCESETIIAQRGEAGGTRVRVVRPAALMDWRAPELPGLCGRRLFGDWHLGLGRPSLPLPVCGVEEAASVVGWCAAHFDQAPGTLNLMDPSIKTRRDLLRRMRQSGWTGRMLWVPISWLCAMLSIARMLTTIVTGVKGEPVAAWQVLRPRRFDMSASTRALAAAREEAIDLVVHAPAAV